MVAAAEAAAAIHLAAPDERVREVGRGLAALAKRLRNGRPAPDDDELQPAAAETEPS